MKSSLLYFTILLFLSVNILAQKYSVTGKVLDKQTKEPLGYTNIKIDGTMLGGASNLNGNYNLKLDKGSYILIASYLGYNSDTLKIVLKNNISGLDFILTRSSVTLPEITVIPGEDPAIGIIRKAIKEKQKRKKQINSLIFEAYTKGVIRTPNPLTLKRGRAGLSFGMGDSSKLPITGIIENQSRGYFKKPDNYKEIIIARKQSANIPPTFNLLTGGRAIKNFNNERINILNYPIPGPLADDALDYYDYYLVNLSSINNKNVYEIELQPLNSINPGFTGKLYIIDKTFDLVKIDFQLNDAANRGGILDTINFYQQMVLFNDSLYLPVDFRAIAEINYLGLVRFGFEMNTILYNYKINTFIDDDIFDKAVIKVLPTADEKDTNYWKKIQSIPNTQEENLAYKKIDSLNSIPLNVWSNFSLLSGRIILSDNLSASGPLSIYHFNRIEGHSLGLGFYSNRAFNKRFNSSINISYGFSDKKTKTNFYAKYFLGQYRTYSISLNAFNNLQTVFGNSESYNELTASLLSLVSKYEFRNYYYVKGFSIKFKGEVFPVLSLSLAYNNRTDKNAVTRTNVSLFNQEKKYQSNPSIYETKINSLTFGFSLDFRNYIENGYFRRRLRGGKSFVLLNGDVTYSRKDFLKSNIDFTQYKLSSFGRIRTLGASFLYFNIKGIYTNGTLPYQYMYSLPGNINATARNYSFRTLNVNEIIGERIVTINIEENFGNELFKLFKIPGFKNWDVQLNTFFNAAFSTVGASSQSILPLPIKQFKHPFYEIGFGLGHILIPIRLEFAWKLNYRGENNFRIGLNTSLF